MIFIKGAEMNSTRQILISIFFMGTTCFGFFWNRNDTRVVDQVMSDPNAMNQNLTVHFNYSPTQIKTPLIFSEKMFSNVHLKEWQAKTSNFLYSKRYFIGATIILGGYIMTCNFFVRGTKYLERTDTWASWHSDIPLEILMATPQSELAKELVLEIQRRYSNAQNPTDFISPLITFIKVIDEEIIMIKQYAEIYRLINKLHLQNIFPINQKQFNMLDEKEKKLIYFKNTFLSWAAEYKVNHNKNRHLMPTYN